MGSTGNNLLVFVDLDGVEPDLNTAAVARYGGPLHITIAAVLAVLELGVLDHEVEAAHLQLHAVVDKAVNLRRDKAFPVQVGSIGGEAGVGHINGHTVVVGVFLDSERYGMRPAVVVI